MWTDVRGDSVLWQGVEGSSPEREVWENKTGRGHAMKREECRIIFKTAVDN